MDKLKELKESLGKMEEKYKEIKGNGISTQDNQNQMMDYFYDCMSSIRSYMWQMEDGVNRRIDNHLTPPNGIHAPHLKTASQVESYLEACNMSADFNVEKPIIYVKASRQGNKEFEVDLNIKSNK